MRLAIAALFVLVGCNNTFDYTMGWGAVYTTRCAARMAVDGDTYRALCEPPPCSEGFVSVAVSHAVVALDPGVKVLGNAERACVQDASRLPGNTLLAVDGERVAPSAVPADRPPENVEAAPPLAP